MKTDTDSNLNPAGGDTPRESVLGGDQPPAAEEGWLLRSAWFYCVVLGIPVGLAVWAYDWRGPWHITATIVHSFALGVVSQAQFQSWKRS